MSVWTRTKRDKQSGKTWETIYVDVQVRLPDGSTSERVLMPSPVQTKREAEKFEAQVRTALLNGTWVSPKKRAAAAAVEARNVRLLRDVIDEFIAHATLKSGADELKRKRRILEREYLPQFGHQPITGIAAHAINADTARKVDGIPCIRCSKTGKRKNGKVCSICKGTARVRLSEKTARNHLNVIHSLLVWAVEAKYLKEVPGPITWPSIPEAPYDYLTPDEASLFMEASAEEEWWRTAFLLALRCGLRRGELRALAWEQVDLKARSLTVDRALDQEDRPKHTKGDRIRVIPLHADVVQALERHPRRLRCDFVFPSERGDTLRENEMKHPIWRAGQRAEALARERGVEGAKPLSRTFWHMLRHSFVSDLVRAGAPLPLVQRLAGHRDIKTTMRYAHHSAADLRAAIDLLGGQAGLGSPQAVREGRG